MSFADTYIYRDGAFVSEAAVLVLISTPLPFMEFKTQHFEPTDERLVVTEADPDERVVSEINGLPAAQEYARMLGVDARDLGPAHFAASPVVVLIDGGNYVRSIQKAERRRQPQVLLRHRARRRPPRGQGCRPRPATSRRPSRRSAPASARRRSSSPSTASCASLRSSQTGVEQAVADMLRANNAVGFNTYGEQFCGVHVNQTLTAIAIGSRRAATVTRRG